MDYFTLVFTSLAYENDILSYKKEFLDGGENMAGNSGLKDCQTAVSYTQLDVYKRKGKHVNAENHEYV